MARQDEIGTCSVCRRRRKLVGPKDPRPAWQAELDAMPKAGEPGFLKISEARRKPPDKITRHFHYCYLCRECNELDADERKAEQAEGEKRVKQRNLKARKAYPVIGGPLDGESALTTDFYSGWRDEDPGMYAHLASE